MPEYDLAPSAGDLSPWTFGPGHEDTARIGDGLDPALLEHQNPIDPQEDSNPIDDALRAWAVIHLADQEQKDSIDSHDKATTQKTQQELTDQFGDDLLKWEALANAHDVSNTRGVSAGSLLRQTTYISLMSCYAMARSLGCPGYHGNKSRSRVVWKPIFSSTLDSLSRLDGPLRSEFDARPTELASWQDRVRRCRDSLSELMDDLTEQLKRYTGPGQVALNMEMSVDQVDDATTSFLGFRVGKSKACETCNKRKTRCVPSKVEVVCCKTCQAAPTRKRGKQTTAKGASVSENGVMKTSKVSRKRQLRSDK